MNIFLWIIFMLVWLYMLHVTKKADLPAWHFLLGSAGLFVIMFLGIMDYITEPLAKVVAAIAGIFGRLTGIFLPYFKYGVIFVDSAKGAVSLKIDFECSGVIEIMAYLSLLLFYNVYNLYEKILLSVVGVFYIIVANALRIIIICLFIFFGGMSTYYVAHAFVGRIFFYVLSVILYFYVFTKSQIIRQKVGGFGYDNHK